MCEIGAAIHQKKEETKKRVAKRTVDFNEQMRV
jgi:hypothetical protein